MQKLAVYKCDVCGLMFELVNTEWDKKANVICCGKPMQLLQANTQEASTEKHIPVDSFDGEYVDVKVGSAPHPMLPEHHIDWIIAVCGNHIQRVALKAGDKPEARFWIGDAQEIQLYAYCNLHGLWMSELKK